VTGRRVGEFGPLVDDAFAAELEGAEGEREDMVSTLSATVVYQYLGGAYSPGAPTRPRSPPQTVVVRRRHG
jgi:hypothetical protein